MKNLQLQISITNLHHQYTYITERAAYQLGFEHSDAILGETVFAIKTGIVELAGFIHQLNQRVITLQEVITTFDIARYQTGLACCVTTKLPVYAADDTLIGIKTIAQNLHKQQFSAFLLELYQQAVSFDADRHFKSLGYEIVDRYQAVNLSVQESTILFLLTFGKTSTQIAHLLHRSPRTIEGTLEHIKNKLDFHTKNELIEYALYTGLNRLIPKGLLQQ
jgi:DNA-binding CsgD family transcriptional regulator